MKHLAYHLLIFIVVLQHGLAVYVTEEMGAVDLSNLGRPGIEYVKKKGVQVDMLTMPSVVMLPGLGGSQLYAVLNKTYGPWYCERVSSGYLIWLALTDLLPGGEVTCWEENMNLMFNGTQFFNASGVQIETISWGSTVSFEYLDPSLPSESAYFASLVESLLVIGYEREINLFGAPYDWRLSPEFNENYLVMLQDLIEKAYAVNDMPVVVICHSMGNMYFHYLLQQMTQAWKDQYIHGYASVAPPWIGATASLVSLISGSNLGIPWLNPLTARVLDRNFPSSYFLLPEPKAYQSDVLVVTPSKNYTAQDYIQLFYDIGDNNASLMYSVSSGIYDPSVAPGVDTIVYHGQNVSTTKQLVYSTGDWDKAPTIKDGNGDGTVPYESLIFGEQWVTDKNYTAKGYTGQTHMGILSYEEFIRDLIADFLP